MTENNIMITGFTGQVGSQLAEFIIENSNYNVIGFMRWQEDLNNVRKLIPRINSHDRVSIAYGDLNDFVSIKSCVGTYRPKYIFHLGAQSFPKTSFDAPLETLNTNIIGTANLLEAIRSEISDSFDPVVHICSSSEVYGKATSKTLLNENTALHGASPYSISKIGTDFLGRFYGEAYGVKTFVTRMGTHSGVRRSDVFFESTVAKQIALIENGLQEPRLFVGNLESVRTFQDVRDAVRAYWLLAEACERGAFEKGEVFNIAGEEKYELTEVVKLMLDLSTHSNIAVVRDQNRIRPLDADYQMFDNTKIKSIINWEPKISVKQMFKDLLDYWREEIRNGRIPLNR